MTFSQKKRTSTNQMHVLGKRSRFFLTWQMMGSMGGCLPGAPQNHSPIGLSRQNMAIRSAIFPGDFLIKRGGTPEFFFIRSMIALGSPRPHRGPRRPAEAGDLPAVEALLAAGADPMAADVGGWTPLMVAAQNGHAEALRQLAGRPPQPFCGPEWTFAMWLL